MSSIQLNVNINFEQLVNTVKQLSPKEKMQINDALWDSNMDIPEEHQELVRQRVNAADKNPARLLDWDTASKKLMP